MFRMCAVLICVFAMAPRAFGQLPVSMQKPISKKQKLVPVQSVSAKRNTTSSVESSLSHAYTCNSVSECSEPSGSCSYSSSIFDELAENTAELRARRTQLSQHFPYESPMEESYYFRPYQPSDIGKQQKASGGWKNPYDNRFLQAIYQQEKTN